MRNFLIINCVVLAFAWAAATSRSQTPPDDPQPGSLPGTTLPEPTTEAPSVPNPGDESPPRDPFSPHGIGGQESGWSYELLTAEEQAIADRGRNVDGWAETHDAFRSAVLQRSAAVTAQVAAHQLGAESLEVGVVP